MALRHLFRRSFIWTNAVAVVGLAYSAWVEPNHIEVTRVSVTLPRMASAFCGYRIVQLSDIHMGDWMDAVRMDDIVRRTNAQKPDLVAITGDFVTRRTEPHLRDLADGLRRLNARDGVVAVLGNHDHWSGAHLVRSVLAASEICELANTVRTIQRGGAQLHIAGVDDVMVGRDQLHVVLARLPETGAAILLAHEPDFADQSAMTGRFDLQLSGHTHGGQIVVPLIGPLQLPALGLKYPSGRYRVREMIQYTNRGVGMVSPFVRLNCRPEITVLELHARKSCACAPQS